MTLPSDDGRRILVVDDEEAILFALQDVLELPGVQVDGAATKEEAFDLLRERHYTAVIADLRLSGADEKEGFSVIQEAKRIDPEVKAVVITAYGESGTRAQAFEFKADYYMEKPVSPHQLVEVLRALGAY